MSAEVIEMTPHTLQRAGVVTEGNQYVHSTAVAPVASMFTGLTRQERELAATGLVETASGMLKQAVEAGESAEVMSSYKDQAAAIADLTKRIDVSKDVVLDAQVLQRRAERALGVAIRAGQAVGTIRGGSNGGDRRSVADASTEIGSPYDFAKHTELYGDGKAGGNGILTMADSGSNAEFDEAVTEAREEGNVSRANVVRKLKQTAVRAEASEDASEAHRSDMQAWHEQLADKYPLPRLAFEAEGRQRHETLTSFQNAATSRYNVKYRFNEKSYARHAAQSADWLERSSMNLEVALDVLTHIDFSTITPEQAHEALQRIEALPHQLKLYIRELKGITNE